MSTLGDYETRYGCLECGLPSDIDPAADWSPAMWVCWGCGGVVSSEFQVRVWNNPAFGALIQERIDQLKRGEGVEFAERPGVVFAPGAAVDLFLLGGLS